MQKEEYKIMYEIEDDYWWYRGLHELVLGAADKFFPDREANILDAGCGTGRMLEALGGYKNKEGLDYSSEAVEFCRQRGLKNIRQEDLSAWEPPEKKYDCLISLDVLYHAAIADDAAVIKKFWQALKPGGFLILNLPAFEILRRSHDAAVWGKRRYLRKKLKNDLEKIGFEIVLISYRLPWLFPIILFKKILEKILKAPAAGSDLKKISSRLNQLFLFLHRLENRLILKNISLPFGSSIFAVVKKRN